MRTTLPLLAAVALVTAFLAPAPSADGAAVGRTHDYERWFELKNEGAGLFTGKFVASAKEGDLIGLRVEADWWNGPGDPRIDHKEKSAMPGVVFEVRRGDGPWTTLPATDREVDLMVRTAAPEGTEGLLGGSPTGNWSIRQVKGGAFPRRLKMIFTCRGDALLVRDLRVKSFSIPAMDPPKHVGRRWMPDRVDNPTLKPEDAVKVVVEVENCGARRTKEVEVELIAIKWNERSGGRRLGFAQLSKLKKGETATVTIEAKLPEDIAEESGVWELRAVVDP
ncbi:MAG: hypothetical protein ACYTG4_09290, partial [Planctomycetota bacterium]